MIAFVPPARSAAPAVAGAVPANLPGLASVVPGLMIQSFRWPVFEAHQLLRIIAEHATKADFRVAGKGHFLAPQE